MPPGGRKSSIGLVRRSAAQKSHLPYRGDDPNVGRKTGVSIQPIQQDSDGFEPFDQLIGQADGLQLSQKHQKRKKNITNEKRIESSEEQEEQEEGYGEMSMDVDSPVQSYLNVRPPPSPRTPRPRPVARTSHVDFDRVPSPKYRSVRKSLPLSSHLRAQELFDLDEEEEDRATGAGYSPREVSFTEMDSRNDLDEDEDPTPKKKQLSNKLKDKIRQSVARISSPANQSHNPSPNKGKRKAVEDVSPSHSKRREFLQELYETEREMTQYEPHTIQSDRDLPPSDPIQAEVAEEPAPSPKFKSSNKKMTLKPSTSLKENREVRTKRSPPLGSVRRSSRVPYPPLEWWRNEKVEYGGRDPKAGPILVPRIKSIIRIPREPVVPLGTKRRVRRRSTPGPDKPVKIVEKIVEKVIEIEIEKLDPEAGWDDETDPFATVVDFPGPGEIRRQVAFTAKMFNPQNAANNDWSFQQIFLDGEFMAAGQMIIPSKSRKPSKPTKDNTFIFYVVEGAVKLRVNQTNLLVATGGIFMVPRGNTYYIENVGNRAAKLFFTQARKPKEADEGLPERSSSHVAPVGRAVSVAGGNPSYRRDPNVPYLQRGRSAHV